MSAYISVNCSGISKYLKFTVFILKIDPSLCAIRLELPCILELLLNSINILPFSLTFDFHFTPIIIAHLRVLAHFLLIHYTRSPEASLRNLVVRLAIAVQGALLHQRWHHFLVEGLVRFSHLFLCDHSLAYL